MPDIAKPTKAELNQIISQAAGERSVNEWLETMLQSIKRVLEEKPVRYRGFGPWWWVLKKAYIEREDYSFGDFLDAEWVESLDYGAAKFNVMAAWLYDDQRFNIGLMVDPFHTLELSDGEAFEYASHDNDMELDNI